MPAMTALFFILTSLFVIRVTRVLVYDPFPPTAFVRAVVVNHWPPPSWQSKLATCGNCMSFWVGLVTLWLSWPWMDLPVIVCLMLPFAWSALYGLYDSFA